jgi:hypothetical protein
MLDRVLRGTARERILMISSGLLFAVAIAGIVATVAMLVFDRGRWISMPSLLVIALPLSALLAGGVAAVYGVRRAILRSSAHDYARSAEREHALRDGSVSGLLELDADNPLARLAAGRLEAALPGRIAPQRSRRNARVLAAGVVTLVVVSAGFSWSGARGADGMTVLLHPFDAARGTLLPALTLHAREPLLQRGERPVLLISAPARRAVSLHVRPTGESWRVSRHGVHDGEAVVELAAIESPVMVFVSDGRGASDTIVVAVRERPFVRSLALEAVYPAALQRRNEPLGAGPLLLPQGTLVRIRGRASLPLGSAILNGQGPMALDTDGEHFTGSFVAIRDEALDWILAGRDGEPIDPPAALEISVIADAPPEVEILTPAADTTVAGDRPVLVSVRAADDHGLSAVRLRVRGGVAERVVDLSVPPFGGVSTVALDISATSPGAHVTVDAIATEAASDRTARSNPRIIRVMTRAQQRAAVASATDSAAAMAERLAAAQRSTERRTSETALARGARSEGRQENSREAGHALASRARSLVGEQRVLAAQADSLVATTRSLESRLGAAGALDDGLAARLAEVRTLLQRALSPDLAARLRDAEQAARDNAEEPLRRSLADVASEQRRARDQLDRVVQMLRRAAIEGSLETLRAEASDLAADPRASDAAERGGQLVRDIGSVRARLAAERARAGGGAIDRARTQAGEGTAALGRRAPAAAASSFGDAARLLGEARAVQIAEWKQELAADLDAAVQELLHIASAEESLARSLASRAGEWRDEHAVLEQAAAAVADRVSAAARKSTLISSRSDGLVRNARDQVLRVSAPSFPPRDRTQLGALMREASAALARAAASLVRDRDRTNSARSASGFTELLEELQRLAREQHGLNASAAGLPLELLAGSESARNTARELGRQQRAIARALEELGDADGGARAQPLAGEANRLADALERAAVDGSVIERQQRLYHRLLEGGRLLAGADGEDDERRDATAARDPVPATGSTTRLPAGRGHAAPGWAELSGLTPVERQLIIEYFERLNGGR